jgi:3-methyladenine DNA glycosylase AlkD
VDVGAIVAELKRRADSTRKPGMARVGIDVSHALGVRLPDIRAIAKSCGVDHALALELWKTEIHEARILATLVADCEALTEAQQEDWVLDITSWDLCDSGGDPLRSRTSFREFGQGVGSKTGRLREAMRVLDDRSTSRMGEAGP